MIGEISCPSHQTCLVRPIDQTDHAVMAKEEVIGDLTDRRTS